VYLQRDREFRQVSRLAARKRGNHLRRLITDLRGFEPMRDALRPIIAKVWLHCQVTAIWGRTVTLKVKFADFQQIIRSRSVDDAIDSLADLENLCLGLLEPLLPTRKGGAPARDLAFVFDAGAVDRAPPTLIGPVTKTAVLLHASLQHQRMRSAVIDLENRQRGAV
jgi:impB/mucB/samB family C-terminal domain